MNKRYQVFVSSTFADLKEERSKVIQTIMELDCIPAGMEIFPAIDEEQFEFIKKVIDDCDYYLLIIGGRYGSISDDGFSYTEKEYDYAIEQNIKVIAFIHDNPDLIPFGKSEKDAGQRKKLELFKQKVSTNRLIKFWNSAEQLPGLVALGLSKTIKTYPATGWIRANQIISPEIIQEMNYLRKENQELKKVLEENAIVEASGKDDLADFEDIYLFSGSSRRWDRFTKMDIKTSWNVKISWGELFASIAPFLLEHPNDANIKQIVSKELYKKANNYNSSATPTIDEQIFQTIKIHLQSLGLVSVKYSQTTKGNMALFWSLTDLGNKMLIHLRSVKK